jgi:4-amino-4-deoxy-L-arabinose transferase-like glycosyltransferase
LAARLTSAPSREPRATWISRWWALPGVLVFALARLPSFFEPHWYSDEAGYATTARELLRGKTLYVDAWNNKPPLQLWTIALSVRFFGASEAALHALTFVSGFLALLGVAVLARRLLSPWRAGFAVLAAGLLLGMPILDAELIVPESLLIAPATWAGVVLITRLSRGEVELGRPELWPIAVGALAAAAIAYQQTAVAEAGAFALILLVAGRSWRRLALYLATVVGLTAAWVGVAVAAAGASRVGYALAGFYVAYTQSVLPQDASGGLRHWGLVLLLTLLIAVGALLQRGTRTLTWALWVWAGATLLISAAAQQPYSHFLTPAVAPVVLAVASLPAPRRFTSLAPRARLGAVPLAAGILAVGFMARTAGLDWIPNVAAPGMNGYRNLATYYGGSAQAAVMPESRDGWRSEFDERVDGDEAAATWVRTHGLAGHSAVVWSNDPWPYLLADLPLMLPTPPIYNDVTLLGQNGQVSARVKQLNPELIVTGDDAVLQFPEVKSVLSHYRAVCNWSHVIVWLRQDVDVPPLTSS